MQIVPLKAAHLFDLRSHLGMATCCCTAQKAAAVAQFRPSFFNHCKDNFIHINMKKAQKVL
jgi:hypothetical protein